MVFSLFGKRPSTRRSAAKTPSTKTSAATPPKSAEPSKSAPAEEPVRPAELPSLDFALQEGRDADGNFVGSSNLQFEDACSESLPAIDEAAMLYANGHDEAALSVLEAALNQADAAAGGELMWAMLFDVYQMTGRREAFESRAIDYVLKFEKSPPTWVGEAAGVKAGGGSASLPLVTLSGSLTAASARQVEQLRRIANQSRKLRVDLGKLQGADNDGCALLLQTLQVLKRAGQEVIVLNPGHLVRLLESQVEPGRRDAHEIWLLLLELYQRQGLQEQFEEIAVQYAVTFEVSPPSWESHVRPHAAAPTADAAAQSAVRNPPADVFRLQGEIAGGGTDVFQALSEHAAARSSVVIDLSTLRRMDFTSAGIFLNTLSNMAATGKSVRITQANSLVAALLGIIGVKQVASVERRK